MFFVLIRYIDDNDNETWDVIPHGRFGLKAAFDKRSDAIDLATEKAMDRRNAFRVVESVGLFERSVNVTLSPDLEVAAQVKDAHDANSQLSRLP